MHLFKSGFKASRSPETAVLAFTLPGPPPSPLSLSYPWSSSPSPYSVWPGYHWIYTLLLPGLLKRLPRAQCRDLCYSHFTLTLSAMYSLKHFLPMRLGSFPTPGPDTCHLTLGLLWHPPGQTTCLCHQIFTPHFSPSRVQHTQILTPLLGSLQWFLISARSKTLLLALFPSVLNRRCKGVLSYWMRRLTSSDMLCSIKLKLSHVSCDMMRAGKDVPRNHTNPAQVSVEVPAGEIWEITEDKSILCWIFVALELALLRF